MRKEQAGGNEAVSDADDGALRDTVLALTARTRAMLGELEAYRREIERWSSGRKTVLLMAAPWLSAEDAFNLLEQWCQPAAVGGTQSVTQCLQPPVGDHDGGGRAGRGSGRLPTAAAEAVRADT
jgi:hypothetical protein